MTADGDVEILQEDPLYQGFVRLTRVTARVPARDGGTLDIVREVHDHGNIAVVLPVDFSRKKAVLVRQWRIPAWLNGHKHRLWEAAAGIIDEGETPEACARRETLEETGYELKTLRKTGEAFSSPGIITEYFHLFLGEYETASKRHGGGGLDNEGEDIEVVEMSFDDLARLRDAGDIVDAKTLMLVSALFEAGSHAGKD